MQLIVASLLRSIPMLGDVFILACFYFTVCGITCVELFRGALVYRCASPDFTLAQADSDGYLLVSTGWWWRKEQAGNCTVHRAL